MYRIAQNLWLDRIRSQKVRGEVANIDGALEIAGSDGRDVTDSRLTLQAVASSISRLPPDQQLVIAHVCIDGLTYRQAADALGIPIGTVMSRLARARTALHEAITGGETLAAAVRGETP